MDLPSELSTAKSSASPDALIDRLFQKFSTMYGKSWSEMWIGIPMDAIKADWGRALYGVEPEAMRLALDAMVTAGKPFPPSQPEFVSLCRQFKRRGPHVLSLVDKSHGPPPPGGFKSIRDILRGMK